jgi:hypothetical protein
MSHIRKMNVRKPIDDKFNCKHEIIDVKTLSECPNTLRTPSGICGPLVAKIPVILAEPTIQVDIEAVVRLQKPALEIKRIRKEVHVTECKVIPTPRFKTFKLFLGGFVRKNIEFATVTYRDRDRISGNIEHTTVEIPFNCVTAVTPTISPEFFFNRTRPQFELDLLSENGLERDPKEMGSINKELFTEKPFCELVSSEIVELDIEEDEKKLLKGFPGTSTFQVLRERMIVEITLKVLQNLQVNIPFGNEEPDKW